MILRASPHRALLGETQLPGDKSISHRAALFAAMAAGESRLDHFLRAGVTQAMLDALAKAGVKWRWEDESLLVQGCGADGFVSGGMPLHCGNSATTFRLLAGVLASCRMAAPGADEFILDGSAQLRRRPMGRLIEPLRAMGANIQSTLSPDSAPLSIRPSQLQGVEYHMPVASAQVKSAVLLAGLSASSATTVMEPSPSRDHTERFLRWLGVRVEEARCLATVHPISTPLPSFELTIPGDISSAAFLIVAAAIVPGSDIRLRSVGMNPRRTGLLSALQRMGAACEILDERDSAGEPIGDLRIQSSGLTATTVEGGEVVDMIDEFPIFAIAAACAEGTTLVRQAQELRHKESDRITALSAELRKLGVQVEESSDGFAIHGPTQWRTSTVDAHGDHRMAMALAVAGLIIPGGVTIEGADRISESFPNFVPILNSLGAELACTLL
jgi:3-phosphoshikimate 1-carboxyvinyltransferase